MRVSRGYSTRDGAYLNTDTVQSRLTSSVRLVTVGVLIVACVSSCSLIGGEQPLGSGERGEDAYVPADVFEAIEVLDRELPRRARSQLRQAEEEDLILFHFGLGMGLRNDWGLWRDSRLAHYFRGLGVDDADEMSGVILAAYHRHMHGRDIRLDELLEQARVKEHDHPSDPR
jgi:hypothetical protein